MHIDDGVTVGLWHLFHGRTEDWELNLWPWGSFWLPTFIVILLSNLSRLKRLTKFSRMAACGCIDEPSFVDSVWTLPPSMSSKTGNDWIYSFNKQCTGQSTVRTEANYVDPTKAVDSLSWGQCLLHIGADKLCSLLSPVCLILSATDGFIWQSFGQSPFKVCVGLLSLIWKQWRVHM